VRKWRVFLDASVIIPGIHSPTGGSGAILQLIWQGKLAGFTSLTVLKEAEDNIVEKFSTATQLAYYSQIGTFGLTVLEPSKPSAVRRFYPVIVEKDAHVLASANQAKVDFLITLDRKDFKQSKVIESVPFKIVTPGEFLGFLTRDNSRAS